MRSLGGGRTAREWRYGRPRSDGSWGRTQIYGADAELRPDLVAVARERAQRLYDVPADVPVVLVGDTPRDVEAALTTGSGIVAVASGIHSSEELAAAGASVVLPDLSDTAHLLGVLETFAAQGKRPRTSLDCP